MTIRVLDASLPPNESRILFLTASFESEGDVPDALDHRIEAEAAANPGATEPSSVSYRAGHLDLSRHTTPVFSPPLEGEGWLVANGCCALKGAHRGAVQPFNAELFDSFLVAGDAGDEAEFDRALQGEASLPRRAELNPSEHENELPLDNTIVDFPSE